VSALAVDIFGYIAYKWKKITAAEYFLDLGKERKILQTTMLFLIALFFLGTVAISGRFGDYFTFFAVIYVAFSFDYVFRSLSISGSKAIKRGLASGLIVALIYIFSSNLFFLQDRLAHGARENEFYRIGTWLEMNTKPHDIVFVSNWGLFPELYYFSPENYYTSGIEPRFLYTYNPELYWLSIHIAQNGYVCTTEKCPDLDAQEVAAFRTNDGAEKWAKNEGDKIVDVLTQQFHSQYIVTTTSYMTFNYILNHNSHFQDMVYDTNYGNAVYKIK